jgi:hypothetical protein
MTLNILEVTALLFKSRRHFLCCGISGLASGLLTGCGTIMYPERRGQSAGPLDWKIVGLDALGLLFFFVPGVIAFAVDFNNGTIYMPSDGYGAIDQVNMSRKFTSFSIPSKHLSRREIGLAISKHSGLDVDLQLGKYETHPMKSIDDFWVTRREMIIRS